MNVFSCNRCHWRGRTNMTNCPKCGTPLTKGKKVSSRGRVSGFVARG